MKRAEHMSGVHQDDGSQIVGMDPSIFVQVTGISVHIYSIQTNIRFLNQLINGLSERIPEELQIFSIRYALPLTPTAGLTCFS